MVNKKRNMAKTSEIVKIIKEQNKEAFFIEGLEKALIGTGRLIGGKFVAVYDSDKCLEILIKSGLDELEALEYYNMTLNDTTPNENKPIFINDWRKTKNLTKKILKESKDSLGYKEEEKQGEKGDSRKG